MLNFFSKVDLFYLNIGLHTEFYTDRLKNFKDTNYVVTNTKFRISGKPIEFGKILNLFVF